MHCLLLLLLMFTIKNIDAADQSNVYFPQAFDLTGYGSLVFYRQNQIFGSYEPFTLFLDAQRTDRRGTFRETFSQLPYGQNPTIFVKENIQTGRNQVFTEPISGAVAYTCPLFVNPIQLPPETTEPKTFQLKPPKKEFVPKNKQTVNQPTQAAGGKMGPLPVQDEIQKIALRIATENLTPEQRTDLVVQMNQLLLHKSAATGADSTPAVTPAAQSVSTGNQPPISFSFLGPVDPAIAAEKATVQQEVATQVSPTTSAPQTTYVRPAGPTAEHKPLKKTAPVVTVTTEQARKKEADEKARLAKIAAEKKAQEEKAQREKEEQLKAEEERRKAEITADQQRAQEKVWKKVTSKKGNAKKLEQLTLAERLEPKDSKKQSTKVPKKQEKPDTEIEPESSFGADSVALQREKIKKKEKTAKEKEEEERRLLDVAAKRATAERADLSKVTFTENPKTEEEFLLFMRAKSTEVFSFATFKKLSSIMKNTQLDTTTRVHAALLLVTQEHHTFTKIQLKQKGEILKEAVELGVAFQDPLLMLEKARQAIEKDNKKQAIDLLKTVKEIIDQTGQADESDKLTTIYRNLTEILKIKSEQRGALVKAELARLQQPPVKRVRLLETKKLGDSAGVAETIFQLSEQNPQPLLQEDPTIATLLNLLTEEEKAMIKVYCTCLKDLRGSSLERLQEHLVKRVGFTATLLQKKLSEDNLTTMRQKTVPELLALYTMLSKLPEAADDTSEHAQLNKQVLENLMLVLQCIERIKLQLLQQSLTEESPAAEQPCIDKSPEIYLQSLDTLTTAVTKSSNANGIILLMLNDHDENLQQLAIGILNQRMQRAEYTVHNVKDFHSVHHVLTELENFLTQSKFPNKEHFLERLRIVKSDYLRKDSDEKKEEIHKTFQELVAHTIHPEYHTDLDFLIAEFMGLPEDSTPVAIKNSWQNLFSKAFEIYTVELSGTVQNRERIINFLLKLINVTSSGYKLSLDNFFAYFFELIKEEKIPLEKAVYLLYNLNKAIPTDSDKIKEQQLKDHFLTLSKDQNCRFTELLLKLESEEPQTKR